MPKRGKRYTEGKKLLEPQRKYSLDEAMTIIQQANGAKFDETVETAVRLGVNPRHADQMVRGAVVLPNGIGRSCRVLVFAKGEKEKEAQEAGADCVGAEDMIEKIQGGWLDFDKAVATPDMMGAVSKLGKILGPKGLMPNPKVGTVTFDVARAIKECKAGKVEFRVEKAGIVHAPIGKKSFGADKLKENFLALMDMLMRLKPSSSKGVYLRSVALSTTMGVGIKVDVASLRETLK